jgi:hypothetical protein
MTRHEKTKIVDGFSVRETTTTADGKRCIRIMAKGTRWPATSARATIWETKGGCWIVSSHFSKVDAFSSLGEAMKDALARAARGHRYGEG